MSSPQKAQAALEEVQLSVPVKLAALWTSLMFLIIYLDYFHLYMPGSLQDMLAGKVFVFDVSQAFLLAALAMIGIPTVMIFLSVLLPAAINRRANILSAAINVPLLLFNLAGIAWGHMIVGAAIQMVILALIIYYAWKWPRKEV
jgi:hypothetical protein